MALAERCLCPNRVRTLQALGADIVLGERAGYRITDVDGRSLLDLHLNGGTFNLGHRNPALVEVLVEALQSLDIGNHHFPSVERALLAEQLVALTPGMRYAVFGSGGGEAVDLAIKSARRATGRSRVVSVDGAYHGHTGLALAAGDARAAVAFGSTGAPGEFVHVPFDDVASIERELAAGDVAAVLLETIPATVGFPLPGSGYLARVRALCDRHGAAYLADEVQTGLGRTGALWAYQHSDVVPDAVIAAKGLSGGLYPISATLLNERLGAWLEDDGWSHVSTFGGAEPGARLARAVLGMTNAATTTANVAALTERFAVGLARLRARHPGWLLEIRQSGLVIGLRFPPPDGGLRMTGALLEQGVWAMFAGFAADCLQVKPGLLLAESEADEALAALDAACASAASGAGLA